ncbi:hypothetical protein RUM43_000109 [Polyplax serrata]|uniref:Uncharacterized protein n=1 Tax=Polyplax serrata TaxID=468196 RepID=A0AAN8SFE7_POLSC
MASSIYEEKSTLKIIERNKYKVKKKHKNKEEKNTRFEIISGSYHISDSWMSYGPGRQNHQRPCLENGKKHVETETRSNCDIRHVESKARSPVPAHLSDAYEVFVYCDGVGVGVGEDGKRTESLSFAIRTDPKKPNSKWTLTSVKFDE